MPDSPKVRRRTRAELDLEAVVLEFDDFLELSARDVRNWLEHGPGTRWQEELARQRRRIAAHQLFSHPATPSLARWLSRYAEPARVEIALVEAHKVASRISAGELTPGQGVAGLRRLARRSWEKEQGTTTELERDVPAPPLNRTHREASLALEVLELIDALDLIVSPAIVEIVVAAVDQGVDYLADEAERWGESGRRALEPRLSASVPAFRRVSQRVAHGHPAGRAVRALVMGQRGLIGYALERRRLLAMGKDPMPLPEPVAERWVWLLDLAEGALERSGRERPRRG
ncbi:MAG: hypothetical protein M0Z30_13295 [Actinomycetota bacterium]|nr:hypothetical protein [Actinomycetota bacterium]